MAVALKVSCLFLVAAFSIQLSYEQTVPDRCRCISPPVKLYSWKNIDEFFVTPPRTRCPNTEIIVTLKTVNAETGQGEKRCLNTETKQAKILRQCWARKNADNSKVTVKFSECGMQKNSERK